MGGRMYDPVLGRFLSPDPFVADVLDGQALNRYSYVLNNPMSKIDPSGFQVSSLYPVDTFDEECYSLWDLSTGQLVGSTCDLKPITRQSQGTGGQGTLAPSLGATTPPFTANPAPSGAANKSPAAHTGAPSSSDATGNGANRGSTRADGLELIHSFLDIVGMAPFIGEAADGINALVYLAEGRYGMAAISAAALIPFAGIAATAGKGVLKYADEGVEAAEAAGRHLDIGYDPLRSVDSLPSGGTVAPATKQGGRYKDLTVGPDQHRHHTPADSASPLSRGNGPAVKMDIADHKQTASHGSQGLEGKAYRAEQKRLIDQGRFDDAVQMDIDDIQGKFGDKYDDAILEMIDSL
jgi:hypothetical protein